MRVVELQAKPSNEKPRQWVCGNMSDAWVIRLEGLICVLDCEASENLVENEGGVAVQLTEQSMEAAEKVQSLEGWDSSGPEPVPAQPPSRAEGTDAGRRPRRFRARRFCHPKKKAAPKALKGLKTKKVVKKAKNKKPAAAAPEPDALQAIPANFRRNQAGRQMIRETMQRCMGLDLEKHASKPLFNDGDQMLRLRNVPASVGVTWPEVKGRAPAFFEAHFYKARTPEVYGGLVHRYFQQIFEDLKKNPSQRNSWILLVKSICENTARALV